LEALVNLDIIYDYKRTFVLGLGNQKCGTSWLHKYLCQSNKFAEGFTKEFHVWDRRDIPLFSNKKSHLSLKTLISPKRYQRYRMENSDDYYFSYFDKLMRGEKVISADITPSYSGLKAQRLEYLKNKFFEKGIDIKIIILVRDPLSRIKSAVRFNLDRGDYSEGIKLNETDFESALIQYYDTEHCLIRTKYENIIAEAESVFTSDSIYIGFYENMFEKIEVERLSKFLQVEPKFDFAKVKVNKTRNAISDTFADLKVKAYYADTYEYFYKNYPVSNELWN
jgi:hypothetical protein